MRLSELLDLAGPIAAVFVGVLVQLFSLAMPLRISRWGSDYLWVLTFISFQVLLAALVFHVIPAALALYALSARAQVIMVWVVFCFAMYRSISSVPLELSSPDVKPADTPAKLTFVEFFDKEHMQGVVNALAGNDPGAPLRYRRLKETLLRRRPPKVEGNFS